MLAGRGSMDKASSCFNRYVFCIEQIERIQNMECNGMEHCQTTHHNITPHHTTPHKQYIERGVRI